MAIKIQTKKAGIPVYIGDLEFTFDFSDEEILKLRDEALKVQQAFHSISPEEDDEKALKQGKDALKQGFDFLLGEGAFEKIYELSPSVMICFQYFVQLVEGLEEELQNMGYVPTQQELAKKYLAGKK